MQQERDYAFKLIAIQTALLVIFSLLFILFSVKAAYSVMLGGVCCILPSIYFAHKVFHYLGARRAKQAIRAFYFAELVKLLLIALFSIVVFKFVAINLLDYLLGFIIAQLAFWIAPKLLFGQQRKVTQGAI